VTGPTDFTIQRSSRDADAMAASVTAWLATQLPEGANPEVSLTGASDANGMSSETVLAKVDWTEGGLRRNGDFVMRIAPSREDLPVFAEYELDHQYDLLKAVHERTQVPVPQPRWLEPTGDVIGSPFFFMNRVDGVIPPDVMPYTFGDNWLFEAAPEQRALLQNSTIGEIAALHAIENPGEVFGFLDRPGDGTALKRHLDRTRAWYEYAINDESGTKMRSSLADRAFDWLYANLPDTDEAVLSWGDSRIGNVIYEDFKPVAVLDWEMAGLGPRQLDLAWLAFAHEVFQGIAGIFELPGLPDFLQPEDIAATYAEITGIEIGDLTWYRVYAGVQWGIVFMRTGMRQFHFGEIEKPESSDALMHHSPVFKKLLEEVGA
jgi:aminoglycoside phosphotransferase (APT) family kinase protein